MHSSKRCFKCGMEKPISSFYKHGAMLDGHLGKCKECTKQDVHKNRMENLDRYRAYDIERAKLPHRLKLSAELCKKRRSVVDGYSSAHCKVSLALKNGSLIKQKCMMCGTTKNVHAHHDDYKKPLDVMWLCVIHHKSRHAYLENIGKETF